MSNVSNNEFEFKLVEMFKLALTDISTTISFYKKFEAADDVAILNYKGNTIIIYKLIQPAYYQKLSEKWKRRFKSISNDVIEYNTMLNNKNLDEKPIHINTLSFTYDNIIAKVSSKYSRINRWLYGEPWVEYEHQRTYYHIKYNQLSIDIKEDTYNLLFSYALEMEKQKTILNIDAHLTEYLNNKMNTVPATQNDFFKERNQDLFYNIDDILDKISKTGIESLTENEKEFLKCNGKK